VQGRAYRRARRQKRRPQLAPASGSDVPHACGLPPPIGECVMRQERLEVESNPVSGTMKTSWCCKDATRQIPHQDNGEAKSTTAKAEPRRSGKTAGSCRKDGTRLKLGVSRCRAKDPHMDRSADAKFQQGDLVSKPHSISALMCWNKRPVKLCFRLHWLIGQHHQSLHDRAETNEYNEQL
jgi:hypothetical protein